jgi:hypothetical protein
MEIVAVEKTIKEAAWFEIRAKQVSSVERPDLYELTIIHFCPTRANGKIIMEEGWKRCPWCSRQIPKKIREVFES